MLLWSVVDVNQDVNLLIPTFGKCILKPEMLKWYFRCGGPVQCLRTHCLFRVCFLLECSCY